MQIRNGLISLWTFVGRSLGDWSLWCRDRWLLATTGILCASWLLAAPLVPRWLLFSGKTAAFVAAGAAIVVVLDRVADLREKQIEKLVGNTERGAVSNALTSLLGLLDSAQDIAFTHGVTRQDRLKTIRAQLVESASTSPTAMNVRATYYPLERDNLGWRILRNPKSRGRPDEASTEFFEKDDPDHPIWTLMSSRDSDCKILEAPDTEPRIDWKNKKYNCVISVPVAAQNVVFGMLSVNAPQVGDLTEADRLMVVAMARVVAAVLALVTPPKQLIEQNESSAIVSVTQEGGRDV